MKTKQSVTKSTRAAHGASTPAALPEISGLAERLSHLQQCAPLLLTAEGVPTSDRERQEFCSYLEESFPELRRLRRRLNQALHHRDELSRSLKPLVDKNYFQLAARGAGELPDDHEPSNKVIDHAMQLMWDLWSADERFHELAEKVNSLEASLENAVPQEYRRILRWCLRRIERG
jgi:DNA repair ATPase RecN